jgi:alkanesulfonate monooxygenase SsuD/methylene tetrahydromethanopterin reductase-like flavin-dependent oxidoreductase (luciferase family)
MSEPGSATPRESGRRLLVGVATGTDPGAVGALESRSVDSLWTGGHIASRNPSPEAIVGLARLGALTERVRIGAAVVVLALYPPALVAKQVADIDRASGGRVTLGVGVGGEYPAEFRAMEVPLSGRGRRTDEAIALLRALWSAEEVTSRGRFHDIVGVRIHPPPVQLGGPPIVVAGRRPAAMRRAALLGDGWIPYLYSPRRYADSVAEITRVASEVGRDLSGFEWCAWVFVNIAADGVAARQGAARSIGGTYRQDVATFVDRVAAAGTVAEVSAVVNGFYDAGARHLVFSPATGGDDPRPVLDALFAEVIPALRAHDAAGPAVGRAVS